MAYVIEYYHQYYDIGGVQHRVELLLEESASDSGAVGTAIDYANYPKPVQIRHSGGSKNRADQVIIQPQELVFSFYVHRDDIDTFDALFELAFRECQLKYYVGGNLKFIGWVKADNISHKYSKDPPYVEFSLSANDALSDLKDIPFGDGEIVNERMTGLEILKEALTPTGLELDFKIQLGTYETTFMTSSDCALEMVEQDTRRFLDQDGDKTKIMSCYEVIETVLMNHNVVLKQHDGNYQITNHHELDSYEFTFDWTSLTEQSRDATDNIIDISSYQVVHNAQLQKIPPLKAVGVTHKNKDLGGDISGKDLTDWNNVWDVDFYTKSVADGVVTLSSKSSEDPSVNENSLTLTTDFSVTKVTENDYIRLEFDHLLFSYTGAGDPTVKIRIDITRPDESNPPPIYAWCYEEWAHFQSYMYESLKIVESGDYNIKLTFIPDPYNTWYWYSDHPIIQFKVKNVAITKVVNVLEEYQVSSVTYDRYYLQTSNQGIETLEVETLLADTLQSTEVGALVYEDSTGWVNTGSWNTYDHSEGIKLLDIYTRNILNNRYEYKDYIRMTIHDRSHNIDFNNILKIGSKYYTFLSFDQDFLNCVIKASLVELLTTQQSYSNIQEVALGTVDGVAAEQTTNISQVTPSMSITDHDELSGLTDDDHSQYHNDARGDARYYTETELNAGQLDSRYYTETELNNGQLDNRYYTETEVNTWRNSVTQTEMGYLHGVTSDVQTQITARAVISGTPANNQIAVWTGATNIEGDANLTWSGSILSVIGSVGVGTAAPDFLLDLVSGGAAIQLQVGDTKTDETRKQSRIVAKHYTNAEQPMAFFYGDSDGSDNKIHIGGGSSAINAATLIDFWTAANDTTTTGTVRMQIGSNGDFQHPDFTTGFSGTNWQITTAGNAEFRNLLVSGSLKVYELILNRLHYQNGGLIIGAGGGKIATIVDATVGAEVVMFEDPVGNGILPFTVGAIVMVQDFDLNRTTVVKRIVRQVDTINSDFSIDLTATAGWTPGDPAGDDDGILAVGDTMVTVGHVSDTDYDANIYMSAVEADNPFIRIYDGVDSWDKWDLTDKTTIKVQIGNLASLANYDIVPADPGYGLYSDNVYLTGEISTASAGTRIEVKAHEINMYESAALYARIKTDAAKGAGMLYLQDGTDQSSFFPVGLWLDNISDWIMKWYSTGISIRTDLNVSGDISFTGERKWSCAGINFSAINPDTDDVSKGTTGVITASADGIFLTAPVSLPDGVEITAAIVNGNAGASAETWNLTRIKLSDATLDVMATAAINTEDTSIISDAIVDNDTYAYFFYTSSIDNGDSIYGARITYTH